LQVARVNGAWVSIIARLQFIDATSIRRASSCCAWVVVIASDWGVLASQSSVTGIASASIVVIANQKLREVAFSVDASVDGADVVVIAFETLMHTFVGHRVASVHGAWVSIIARWSQIRSSDDQSSFRVASILLCGLASSCWNLQASLSSDSDAQSISIAFCDFSIAVFSNKFRGRLATMHSMAVVVSALITVIAISWGINISGCCLAGSDGASIGIYNSYWGVNTTCLRIASIQGAGIVVITAD